VSVALFPVQTAEGPLMVAVIPPVIETAAVAVVVQLPLPTITE
jgi:hypothetical protein